MAFVVGSSALQARALSVQSRGRVCPVILSSSVHPIALGRSTPSVLCTPTTLVESEHVAAGHFRAPYHAGGKPKRVLLWFHTDLRVEDNEALVKAVESSRGPGGALLPVFVIEKNTSKRSLLAVAELRAALRQLGSELLIVRGKATDLLPQLSRKFRMDTIYCNRSVLQEAASVEKTLQKRLKETSTGFEAFWSNSLFNPEKMTKHSLESYAQVLAKSGKRSVVQKPTKMRAIPKDVALSTEIEARTGNGHTAALKVMKELKKGSVAQQQEMVLRLKEFLDAGCVSPKAVVDAVARQCGGVQGRLAQEMVWRSYLCSTVHQNARQAVRPSA